MFDQPETRIPESHLKWHWLALKTCTKKKTKTLTIEVKAVSGVAQTSCCGLVCIPIVMPDPANSPCPVWSGNGNVVSCCRSSSGRPLSSDCGGRIAPGESSSDVSSLVQSSWSSLGEQLSAEPSTTTAEKNQKIQWNIQHNSILPCTCMHNTLHLVWGNQWSSGALWQI